MYEEGTEQNSNQPNKNRTCRQDPLENLCRHVRSVIVFAKMLSKKCRKFQKFEISKFRCSFFESIFISNPGKRSNKEMKNAGRLLNQVAVITGAASGIGRATATRFATEGLKGLVLADVDVQGLNETKRMVDEVTSDPSLTETVQIDVSKEQEVKSMIDLAEEKFGKLTVLFNNAGIMHSDDGVETEESIWDLTLGINVKGVYFGCKHGVNAMKRAGGGSVINTASFVGHVGAATPQIAYTASKGAVAALTKELAVVFARDNIRVNNLCPGPLNTELLQKFLDTPEKRNRRLVHVPMGRFGEAEEMANAALFLASKESSYVTGASMFVDGGITAAYVTSEKEVDPFGGPNLQY